MDKSIISNITHSLRETTNLLNVTYEGTEMKRYFKTLRDQYNNPIALLASNSERNFIRSEQQIAKWADLAPIVSSYFFNLNLYVTLNVESKDLDDALVAMVNTAIKAHNSLPTAEEKEAITIVKPEEIVKFNFRYKLYILLTILLPEYN